MSVYSISRWACVWMDDLMHISWTVIRPEFYFTQDQNPINWIHIHIHIHTHYISYNGTQCNSFFTAKKLKLRGHRIRPIDPIYTIFIFNKAFLIEFRFCFLSPFLVTFKYFPFLFWLLFLLYSINIHGYIDVKNGSLLATMKIECYRIEWRMLQHALAPKCIHHLVFLFFLICEIFHTSGNQKNREYRKMLDMIDLSNYAIRFQFASFKIIKLGVGF